MVHVTLKPVRSEVVGVMRRAVGDDLREFPYVKSSDGDKCTFARTILGGWYVGLSTL
jgi:hypothetical protein